MSQFSGKNFPARPLKTLEVQLEKLNTLLVYKEDLKNLDKFTETFPPALV